MVRRAPCTGGTAVPGGAVVLVYAPPVTGGDALGVGVIPR